MISDGPSTAREKAATRVTRTGAPFLTMRPLMAPLSPPAPSPQPSGSRSAIPPDTGTIRRIAPP